MEVYLYIDEGKECITVGGSNIGATCKFPFIYNIWDDIPYVPATILRWLSWLSEDITFDYCTDFTIVDYAYLSIYKKFRKSLISPGKMWCATKLTADNRYVPGYWGVCPDTIMDSFVCTGDNSSMASFVGKMIR